MKLRDEKILSSTTFNKESDEFKVLGAEVRRIANKEIQGLRLENNDGLYFFGIGKTNETILRNNGIKIDDLVNKTIKIQKEKRRFKGYGEREVLVIREVVD